MRSSLLFAAVSAAAFLAPLTVSAHVVVRPNQVAPAAFQTFTVSVPNEKEVDTTALRLVVPGGMKYVTPSVKPGWTVTTKKDGEAVTEISWTGGTVPGERRDDFTFSAQAPAAAGTLAWKAYQTYAGGEVVSWDQDPAKAKGDDEGSTPYSITKVEEAASAPAANDTAARLLGGLGLLAGVLGLAASLRPKR